MKPDPRLAQLWREIGEAINTGDVQGVFVVYRYADIYSAEYGCAYRVEDLDDMLLQVRTEVTRIRCRRENEG